IEQTPLEPSKTTVDVEKVWKGEKQDSVTIHLLADGEKVEEVVLSEDTDWKHTFTDLPVVHNITDEKAIEYTVEEVEIEGYSVEITGDAKEGFTIINTEIIEQTPLEPSKTTVDVEKIWKDEKQDSVTIHLLADGETVDEVVLSKDTDWKHTFTDLPVVYDITDEKAIEYTVEEVEIEGYEVSISGNAKDGFIVTNTFIEEDEVLTETPNDESDNDSNDSLSKDDSENKTSIELDELSNEQGHKLPKTATNTFNMLVIGLAVMLLGALALLFRRKENKQ